MARSRLILVKVVGWVLGLGLSPLLASPPAIHLYLNADFTHSTEAVTSIQRGIEVALSEVGNEVQGIPLFLKTLDHRGNATRQRLNSLSIVEDPHYLAMYSGIHSTVLIPNRQLINEQSLLTLVPWAAGGPVTRYAEGVNWVFRLSVDDARAGPFLVKYANQQSCTSPHLLLERSAWGKSNQNSMTRAFSELGGPQPPVTWFNVSVSESTARILLRRVVGSGTDCLLLVANDIEARTLFDALETLPEAQSLRVISHWGMAAGSFWKGIPGPDSADTRMRFIQPCFSFNSVKKRNAFQQKVFLKLQTLYPEIRQAEDLKAHAGFVNAYDLTRLILEALRNMDLSEDMSENRSRLRDALEQLDGPVKGLLKTYELPFSPFDLVTNPNGHEALESADYCMGHFAADGTIYLEDR